MKLLPYYSSSLRSLTGCLFISVVVVYALSGRSEALVKLPPNVTVPAVIVFGDSIVDTGNNNNLKTVIKCNFPPYGEDFKGKIPTGRFCNGRVPSDLLAEELGIKDIVPAYLDPNLSPQQLLTGVSFASGGSGYDPLTSRLVSVVSFSDQLKYFKEYIGKLKTLVGEDRTNFILANAIVLVVAGSDDIANTYFVLHARPQYDIPSYTDLMVNSASEFFKELHQLGLKRVGVLSAPPIGCVPSQRTLAGGIQRDCAEKYNLAAHLFNQKLAATMDSLQKSFTDGKYIYIDIYDSLSDIIQNPQKFGFEEANKGCCGTGNIEVAILCNPLTPTTCKDVSKYVFWDSYHPTEKAYKVLLQSVLGRYIQKFF